VGISIISGYYEVLWKATRDREYFNLIVNYALSSGLSRDEIISLTGEWISFRDKPIYLRYCILAKLIILVMERNLNLIVELKIVGEALKLLEKIREDLKMEIDEYRVDVKPLHEALQDAACLAEKLKSISFDETPTS
jgi:integrase